MKRSETARAAKLMERYERLRRRLADTGLICQGTLMPRVIEREIPPHSGRWKRYGPYYQWTRKIRAKTVTVNLAPKQAKVFAAAIRSHRCLERLLRQMRVVSLEILELTTTGVPRRKRSK